MGIFNRIADVFKANINDILDKAEDPEKMIKQIVIEMEESVNETALAVAQSIGNEKSLERKISKAKKDTIEWEQKAMQALNKNREDLARAALDKKNRAANSITELTPIYQQAKTTADKMREQLNELKLKLDEARSKQTTLIARSQAAKTQKQISQSMSGFGSDAFGKFDKFEQKVEQLESESIAFAELENSDHSLEEEFKKLGSNNQVDDELLALKEKMGILPKSSD